MRLLLLMLLLVPVADGADGWALTVDAPAEVPSGIPFVVRACADGVPGSQVALRLTLDHPLGSGAVEDPLPVARGRYGPSFELDESGRACREVRVAPPAGNGEAPLTVRLRTDDGRVRAEAQTDVRFTEVGIRLVAADEAPAGFAWRLSPWNAIPAADGNFVDARILRRWGAPFEGVELWNAGDAVVPLAALTLAGRPLPDLLMAPGDAVFLGETAPPNTERSVPWRAPSGAIWTLATADRTLDTLTGQPPPGMTLTKHDLARMGLGTWPIVTFDTQGALTAFVTPDAGSSVVIEMIDAAKREVLVEAYTLRSADIGAALARAADRGVRVRVLLEGAPVGGIAPDDARLHGALAARGVDVLLLKSAADFPTRFATQHGKVIVADRTTLLVATENFHAGAYPARPGAGGTRGYGVILEAPDVARHLADVLDADAAPWPDITRVMPRDDPDALLAMPRGPPGPVRRWDGAWHVTPVLSPDHALRDDALLGRIAQANASVDVAMLFAEARFRDASNPFLDALLAAAERGVRVRLLLDGRVDDGENQRLATKMNARAAADGIPLEVRVDDGARTLHAKLVLVDGQAAYVGSLNWGFASATRNREFGLILEAPELVAWWSETYEKDWAPAAGAREVPAGAHGWAAIIAAAWALRRR